MSNEDLVNTPAFRDWLIWLVSESMYCEPTIEAIQAKLFSEDDPRMTIEFDELGILVGTDCQGSKMTTRIKVDDLGSFGNDGDAEVELDSRLADARVEVERFWRFNYVEPVRPKGCNHNGNCDC